MSQNTPSSAPPSEPSEQGHALLDLSAALWAALAAAVLFAVLCAWPLSVYTGGSPWVLIRLFASVFLGTAVLAPPASYDAAALAAGVGAMLIAGFALSLLLSVTIHRFGLLVGIFGGALYGLVVYVAFVYVASLLWPSLWTLAGIPFAIVCVVFGAFAGAVYEWLEVEEFELEQESS